VATYDVKRAKNIMKRDAGSAALLEMSTEEQRGAKFRAQSVHLVSSSFENSSLMKHPARRAVASISSYAPPPARANRRNAQLSLLMEKAGLSRFTNILIAEGFTLKLIFEALHSDQDKRWLHENLLEMNFSEGEIEFLYSHITSISEEFSQDEHVASKQANTSKQEVYYALENDTLNHIASKLGLNVNELIHNNRSHLGSVLKKHSRLKENTEVWLNNSPRSTPISRPLSSKYDRRDSGWDVCHECGEDTADDLNGYTLICGCCESRAHLHCTGLSKAPRGGKWQCKSCSSSWNVEKIIRRVGNHYEVKWEGYPHESNTMEPVKNFTNNCIAQAFERAEGKRLRNSFQGFAKKEHS
jgi:hypothetical protein